MPKLARLMSPASEYPRVKFIQLDSHVVFQTNSGAMKDLQGPEGGGGGGGGGGEIKLGRGKTDLSGSPF